MKQSAGTKIRDFLYAVWRRRYLITVPILIAIPLTLAIAAFAPKLYMARALMLLQEAGGNDPLNSRPTPQSQFAMKERVAGLRALLHSNRVLTAALRDLKGPQIADDPAAFDFERRELKEALSLELRGTDFLEFSLKGSRPQGLGTELQAITTRFLESLLLPEQETMSASQLLLDKRRKELEDAQQAYALFRKTEGRNWISDYEKSKRRLATLEQALETETGKLEAAAALVNALKESQAFENLDGPRLETTINKARQDITNMQVNGSNAGERLLQARQQLERLNQLQSAMKNLTAARTTVAALDTKIFEARQQMAQLQSVNLRAIQLERRVKDAQNTVDGFLKRFAASASREGLQVLDAPQSIKMIDQPRDPTRAENSALKYALMTMLAAIFLGTGLAVIAELVDQRIRNTEELESLTGLPVVAKLPHQAS